MDLALSEEQKMLRDSVKRLLAEEYSFSRRRQLIAQPGASRDAWQKFAILGIPALAVPELHGGYAPAHAELAIVGEAFGQHLVQEPFVATVSAAAALAACPENAGIGAILAEIAEGKRTAVFAEGGEVRDGRPHGRLSNVLNGADVDYLIVAAGGRIWLSQDHVAAPAVLQDDRPAATITLDGPAELLSESAERAIAAARDHAIAMLCAEAAGAMVALLDLTLDHLRTRQQFGLPIASFQALQHRAAEMAIEVERARGMALYAALSLASDAESRWKAVSAAKVLIVRAGRFVGRQAIQLHGGIGLTEEHMTGHYYRRLAVGERLLGGQAEHLARLVAAGGILAPMASIPA